MKNNTIIEYYELSKLSTFVYIFIGGCVSCFKLIYKTIMAKGNSFIFKEIDEWLEYKMLSEI